MNGQGISENNNSDIDDIFGNTVMFGIARNLDEVSIYIWGEYQPAPIVFNIDKIDQVIDLLIDTKDEAFKEKTTYLNKEEMYVAECCDRIVYGVQKVKNEKCIYCKNDITINNDN